MKLEGFDSDDLQRRYEEYAAALEQLRAEARKAPPLPNIEAMRRLARAEVSR